MAKKTCAACDCELDANPINVKIGGRTVEVCCDDCAQKLNESQAAAVAPGKGLSLMLAAAVLGALFLTQAPVVRASESANPAPAQRVSYADLNLSQPAAIETLYVRLGRAARNVCSSYTFSVQPNAERLHSECIARAISGAVSEIGNPALTARHLGTVRSKAAPLQAVR